MKYVVSPFDVALQENGSGSLRSVAGTFIVEDENIGHLLNSLKDFHIISEDELKEIVEKLTSHSYEDVLKYLIHTTAILRSFLFEQDIVVDAGKKDFELLSICLIQGLDIKNLALPRNLWVKHAPLGGGSDPKPYVLGLML